MLTNDTLLKIVRFNTEDFDPALVAERLTFLKARASRTPTPVTVEQLREIEESSTSILLLQFAEVEGGKMIVGMVHIAIIYLEDRAHIGPIAVDTEATPRGHGTPLMEAAITYVKEHYPEIRRADLTNRPSHDLEAWYARFGFKGRTEQNADPTTVYRLSLK